MTSKKAKKPPIDKKSVRDRLERALSEQLFVGIRRWIPDTGRIDGFVVAIGDEWVAIAGLDSVRLDGWHVLRLKDIQAVFVDPDVECLQTRALKARSQWPPPAPVLDLSGAQAAVTSVAVETRVAAVHVEFDRPDICWEGKILGIDAGTVRLLEVTTQATWRRKPRLVDIEDITRLDFGADYESALDLLAGPLPSA